MKTKTQYNGGARVLPAPLVAMLTVLIWLGAPAQVLGQPAGCTFVADGANKSDRILRCGEGPTIRTAPNTRFRLTGQEGEQPPTGAQLDAGALLIEFTPGDRQKNFQILTPHAVAAVRGTQWAVQVVRTRTSTLVISGAVEVTRPQQNGGVVLQAGQGVDVSAGTIPIVAKRWAKPRVDTLMALFAR